MVVLLLFMWGEDGVDVDVDVEGSIVGSFCWFMFDGSGGWIQSIN